MAISRHSIRTECVVVTHEQLNRHEPRKVQSLKEGVLQPEVGRRVKLNLLRELVLTKSRSGNNP